MPVTHAFVSEIPDTASPPGAIRPSHWNEDHLVTVDLESEATGTLAVENGGTGQSTANGALNALLPSQTGNGGKALKTDGANASWSDDTDTGITELTGDVTAGPGSGSQAATVVSTHLSAPLPVAQGGTGTATAFTQGSVIFAGASGVHSQDNANLFWDDANNSLGIGTNTPFVINAITMPSGRKILNLTNTVAASQFAVAGTETSGVGSVFEFINLTGGSNLKWFTLVNGAGKVTIRAVNDNGTVKYTMQAYDLSTGYSGFGTASPNFMVSAVEDKGVASGNKAIGWFGRNNSGAGPGVVLGYYADGSTVPGVFVNSGGNDSTAGNMLYLGGNNNPRVVSVDATNSRVGIGTVSPSNTLTVAGTGRITKATQPFLWVNWTDTSTIGGLQFTENGNGTLDNGLVGNFLALGSTFSDATRRRNLSFQGYNGLEFWTYQNTGSSLRAMDISSAGRVGIGTSSPTNILSLGGNSARTLWMERHTTSNTAGNTLTVQAGGATSGATDKDGGNLLLAPGASTGTGRTQVNIKGYTAATATGTSDNTQVDREILGGFKPLTNNSAIALVNCTLASNTAVGGTMRYTVEVFDGTDLQVESGMVSYNALNKGGAFSGNTVTKFGNQQSVTAGTLTVTFTISAANPAAVSVNANSSLTPSTGYPRITYNLDQLSQQAVAIQ